MSIENDLTVLNKASHQVEIDWISQDGLNSNGSVDPEKKWSIQTYATPTWTFKVNGKDSATLIMKTGNARNFYLGDNLLGGV